jgi:hypothetical protein
VPEPGFTSVNHGIFIEKQRISAKDLPLTEEGFRQRHQPDRRNVPAISIMPIPVAFGKHLRHFVSQDFDADHNGFRVRCQTERWSMSKGGLNE